MKGIRIVSVRFEDVIKRVVTLTCCGFFLAATVQVRGQEDATFATPVDIDAVVEQGSLICRAEKLFVLCSKPYDPELYGVISLNPAVALEPGTGRVKLLGTSGTVRVRVSTVNGVIEEGNHLTTTTIPGVAGLADRNGYVLGTALERYGEANPNNVGTISVALNIHLRAGFSGRRSNLFEFLRQGLSSSVFEPLDSLRYLLASIILILSFGLGIVYFGRVSRAGVEALGRNPLAKNSIQFSIFVSTLLTFVMILVGLGLAYLILIL